MDIEDDQLDIFSLEIEAIQDTDNANVIGKGQEKKVVKENQEQAIQTKDTVEGFQLKDYVQIIHPNQEIAPDDEVYVSEFVGKKGTIVEIVKKSSPVAYWVDFGKQRGIFYESDMSFLR